jgi:hypothetical protein
VGSAKRNSLTPLTQTTAVTAPIFTGPTIFSESCEKQNFMKYAANMEKFSFAPFNIKYDVHCTDFLPNWYRLIQAIK